MYSISGRRRRVPISTTAAPMRAMREHGDHRFEAIGEHDRHAIALADAARGKTGGQPVDAAVELAIGQPR